MKTIKNLALCIGLVTLISPLAGCSDTWHGVKEDWHNMTGSSDSSDNSTVAAAPAQTAQPAQAAPAQAAAPAQDTTLRSETTTTTTYNR